ncbi:hypothetical protein LINPERHAP2_LOCUS5966, partial [Linum perenne]
VDQRPINTSSSQVLFHQKKKNHSGSLKLFFNIERWPTLVVSATFVSRCFGGVESSRIGLD